MRTRDKQRIFRRFFGGTPIGRLVVTVAGQGIPLWKGWEFVENIIREGVANKWEVTK